MKIVNNVVNPGGGTRYAHDPLYPNKTKTTASQLIFYFLKSFQKLKF